MWAVETLHIPTESQPENCKIAKPEQMTELTRDVHRTWVLQNLSGDGSPLRQRREIGKITENSTTTIRFRLCNVCRRICRPATDIYSHSPSINLFVIIIIILDDSDHHIRSRGTHLHAHRLHSQHLTDFVSMSRSHSTC